MEIKPSHIYYWKDDKWKIAKRNGKPKIFVTNEEVAEWYKMNRWRVDGLSIVKPILDGKQQRLET